MTLLRPAPCEGQVEDGVGPRALTAAKAFKRMAYGRVRNSNPS